MFRDDLVQDANIETLCRKSNHLAEGAAVTPNEIGTGRK